MEFTFTHARSFGFFVAAIFAWGGCASAPHGVVGTTASPPSKAEKPPFAYEPLNVRNSCFVESVHFYDQYFQKNRGGEKSWARILEWGNQEGDFQISSGHAVTVFVARDRLWYYDINFGVIPVALPLDRRADITDVSPKVFSRYPQFRPIFARYREDFPQQPAKERVDFLFYHANRDVRDATRVASALGRFRPVRVFEFDLKEGEKKETSAAAGFVFGRRVCFYFPRRGTFEAPKYAGGVDDLRYIGKVVQRLFPTANNVRWQPGGYLLFPNEKKK